MGPVSGQASFGSPQMTAQDLFVRALPAPESWFAASLPVQGFPATAGEIAAADRLWNAVAGYQRQQSRLKSEVVVQIICLHHADGPARMMKNGAKWMPMVGLGVFPNDPPPTIWAPADFEDLGPGEMPRPLMHQVLRITAGQEERDAARRALLGLGTIVEIWHRDVDQPLLNAWKELLVPPITDPAFLGFPVYVPLLRAASVETASATQLEEWLAGARFYVRESNEDRMILFLSPEPLDPLFQACGGRRVPEEGGWRFSS